MKRIMMLMSAALMAALLGSFPLVGTSEEKPAGADEKPAGEQYRLTLKIDGVECPNCARVMTRTLAGTPLKVVGTIKPNTTGPSSVVAECPKDGDLGAAAKAVNEAQTPHRDKVAPSLTLVLFAELNDDSAATALAACRKISGIDGAACRASAETGQIELRVSGTAKTTVPQILTAMSEAGVEARTTPLTKSK